MDINEQQQNVNEQQQNVNNQQQIINNQQQIINNQQQIINNQQQIINELRDSLAPLTDAITILTNQVEEVQAQNQQVLDENRQLKSQVRERINTIPLEVKAVLNQFIQEFKEAMAAKKPSDMSESIKQLAKAMDNLGMKIEDSSTLQAAMSDKVLEAAEEIMQIKDQLPRHAPPKTVAQQNGTPQT